MRVRMKVKISGLRNGSEWPAPGDVIDLPDVEAAAVVAAGMGEHVAEDPKRASRKVTATKPPVGEKRSRRDG